MAGEWNVDASKIAENYERLLVPRIFQPGAEKLLEIVRPKQGDSVLDVACGTGIVARLAADRVGEKGEVVGVDMLPDMLEVARAADSRVRWEQGGADNLPLPDDSYDVVVCQHGLQFFPDKPAALTEMHRVSKPGARLGIVVLTDISQTPALDALAKAFDEYIGPAPAQFVRMVGAMSDRAELEALVAGAGYGEVDVQTISFDVTFDSPEDFVRKYLVATPVAVNPAISEADQSTIRKVEESVAAALGPGGTFPVECHVATGRAA